MKQSLVDDTESPQLQAGWVRPPQANRDANRGLAIAYKWQTTFDSLTKLSRQKRRISRKMSH
jgi:hypothetical protein